MDRFQWAWFAWIVIGLVIEFLALKSGLKGRTLSELVWAISYRYPLLPFAIGALIGHLFWQAVRA